MESEEQELGFVRGHILNDLNLMEYHKRTLDMVNALGAQIKKLEESVGAPNAKQWKNPREEQTYLHNTKTLSVMKRQKERLESKLNELQERIRGEIDAANSVTPLKPLI